MKLPTIEPAGSSAPNQDTPLSSIASPVLSSLKSGIITPDNPIVVPHPKVDEPATEKGHVITMYYALLCFFNLACI